MDGYAGKFLNLNLGDGNGKDFVVPEEVSKSTSEARASGTWLLYNGLEPHVDPLSPKTS